MYDVSLHALVYKALLTSFNWTLSSDFISFSHCLLSTIFISALLHCRQKFNVNLKQYDLPSSTVISVPFPKPKDVNVFGSIYAHLDLNLY